MGPKPAKQPTRSSARNETSPGNDSDAAETFKFIPSAELEQILADQRAEFEQSVKDILQNELSSVKDELVRLQNEIDTVSNVANNALKQSDLLKKELTKVQEENAHLKTQLQNNNNAQHEMRESMEDTKNRQLRKTLVFKGVKEENPNDSTSPNGEKNWDGTKALLAQTMAEALGTSVEEADQMVERAHRASPNPNYKGSAPRLIFAAFKDWRDSERTKIAFRRLKSGIIADQKVGPLTTKRRDMALKERKRLLNENIVFSAFVAHPARLMVKDSLSPTAKYRMHKDFSNEPVKTGK